MKRQKTQRFLALVPVAILISASSASGATLAYYSFDSDFSDGSGNANTLTAGAGIPLITDGEVKFGAGALDLDGSSWLKLDTAIGFGASDAWSVSFWGKRRSGADNRSGMVVGTDGGTSEFIWTPNNTSVVEGMRVRNASGANADYGGFPDDAAYHHWVVIADGTGNVEVYRDNASQGTKSLATTFTIDAVATGAGSANIYDGQLDELYIFDEAINTATVGQLFNNTYVIPEPSTLALIGLSFVSLLHRRRRQG